MRILNTLSCGILLTIPLLVRCDPDEPPPRWEYYNPLSGETLLCDWCAPGEFMVAECTKTTVTQCRTCAENEYTEHFNHVRECIRCRECLKAHERVILECTPTNNRECECEDGFFLAAEFCFLHTKCPIRYGVIQRGNPWTNTKCRRCSSGTFSNVESSVASCRNHTDCGAMGLCVTRRGNRGVDNVCGICPDFVTTATPKSEDKTTISTTGSTEFVSAARQEDNTTRKHTTVTVVRWEPIVYVTIAIVVLAAIIVAFCCVVHTFRGRRSDTSQGLPPLQTTLAGKTPIVSFVGLPKGKESPPTESDQVDEMFETHHHSHAAAAARQTTSARRNPLAMTRTGTPTVPRLRRTKSRPNDDELRRRPANLDDVELIVDDIGGAWRHLGRDLGFSDGRLDGFQNDYPLQLREAVFQMLRTWIEERRGEVTLGKLMDALSKVGKPELAEALLEQTS